MEHSSDVHSKLQRMTSKVSALSFHLAWASETVKTPWLWGKHSFLYQCPLKSPHMSFGPTRVGSVYFWYCIEWDSVRAESYGCDSLRVGCWGSEGVKRVLGRKTKSCSQLECIGIWARYIFYHEALSSVPNTPETAFLACATTCQQCLSGFVTTGRHAVTLPKLPLVPGLWLRASRPWLMSPTSLRVISYSLCIYSQEHRKNMTFLP